jgi:uncharacterized membrane protein
MSSYSSTPTSSTVSTPSSARRRISLWAVSMALVVVALFTSGYLAYTELTGTTALCAETGAISCESVSASVWSRWLGIPVAYLGFGLYVGLFVLLLAERFIGRLRSIGPTLFFGATLFGFLYHCYLTYNSVFVYQAICPWCLATHATITVLLVVSGVRMWQHINATPEAA